MIKRLCGLGVFYDSHCICKQGDCSTPLTLHDWYMKMLHFKFNQTLRMASDMSS